MTLVRRPALAFMILAFLAGASPAFAADEPPVVTAILKLLETKYKVKPSYKSLTTESDGSIVIEGLSAQIAPGVAPEHGSVAVGKIKLSGVTDQGNGLFEVAELTSTDVVARIEGGQTVTISVPQTVAEHVFVKDLGDNPTPADKLRSTMTVARKVTSGPIIVAFANQTLRAETYTMTWDGDPVSGSGKFEFKLGSIAVPEELMVTIDPSGTLKRLGYSSLSFDVGGSGSGDVKLDKLGVDLDLFYAGKDLGTLKVGATTGEIPVALLVELSNLDSQAQPDPNKLVPMIQGIQVSRILVRFEDRSITKKLLPVIAAMQNTDEATMVANTSAMVQLALSDLKNPAFTQKAVEAISAYLKDPRSITLLLKPAQPVTVMQLMSLDPNNPGAAIDQLGISITAND